MAGRPGALQRAHVLFVEANGRRNQSRHTLTIHRAAWEGKGESSNSPRGFYWFVSGHNARASSVRRTPASAGRTRLRRRRRLHAVLGGPCCASTSEVNDRGLEDHAPRPFAADGR